MTGHHQLSADTLFIVNPISGARGKDGIVDRLLATGCSVVVTEYAGHAVTLARNCVENTVVAVGGDGTVNEVARGLLGTGKRFGIIPCGSGDGLALHLGISRNIDKALAVLERGRTKMMDCAEVNGRPFFSVCGTGLDAEVSENFAKAHTRGLATYIREAIKTWRNFRPEEYEIECDGVKRSVKAVLITAGNSDQWGNGARITPLARCDDGLLDLSVILPVKTVNLPVLAFRLMSGTLYGSPYVLCFKGRDIHIRKKDAGNPEFTVPAHYDGDFFRTGPSLNIRIVPEKIEVIC